MADLLEFLSQPAQTPTEPAPAPAATTSPLLDFLKPQAAPEPVAEPGVMPIAPPKPPQPGTDFAPTPLQQVLGLDEAYNKREYLHGKTTEELWRKYIDQVSTELGSQAADPGILRGIQSGYKGLKQFGQAAKALGAKIVGDEEGLKEATEATIRLGVEQELLQPRLSRVEDLVREGTFADFVEWAAFNLGEQAPNIATMAASGGTGAFVGKQVAKLAAGRIVDDLVARQLVSRFVTKGAKAGVYLGATGMETGATTAEQLQATGDVNPLVAVSAGAIKGLLEVQTPLAFAQRFGISEGLANRFVSGVVNRMTAGGVVRRTLGGGLVAAGGEGITEGLQETVDNFARSFVDEHYDALGPEAASRILNAAATGALVGGALGVPAAALAGQQRKRGPALSAAEAEAFLAPTVGFQQPGGFARAGATMGQGTVFDEGLDVEIGRKPGEMLTQVDLSQLKDEDVTATLKSLPDTLREFEDSADRIWLPADDEAVRQEVLKQVRTAMHLRNKAEQRLLNATTGTHAGVKAQQEAREELVKADQLYQDAVAKGFRYRPTDTRAGIIYVGQNPIPATALRQVPSTGRAIEQAEMLNVETAGIMQEATGGISVNAISGPGPGRAWISRKDVKPWQMTTIPALMPSTVDALEDSRITFAPFVQEADKAKLIARLKEPMPGTQDFRPANYVDAMDGGLRYTPAADATRTKLIGISPRQLRHVPAHLGDPTKMGYSSQQRGQGADMQTLTATYAGQGGYLPSQHAPGTVHWLRDPANTLSSEIEENLQRAVNALEWIVRKMAPQVKLIVDTRVNDPINRGNSYSWPFVEDFHVIYLSAKQVRNKLEAAHTVFHEAGHMLHFQMLEKAPADVRSAVFTEWLQHLYRTEKQTSGEFWLGFVQPAYWEWGFGPGVRGAAYHPAQSVMVNEAQWANWYQFTEYMAEQTARWALQPRPNGEVIGERFFKSLWNKMKAMLVRIGKTFQVEMEVNTAIGGWLDSIAQQPMPASVSFLREEAPPALDGTPLVNDQPVPFAESFGLAMQKLGASPTVAKQADKYAWYIRWGWNLLQLASQNRHIAGLQAYVERVRAWHITKMGWISRADGRVKEWRALGKEQGQRLSDFIWDLETMSYLKPGENARQPTLQELIALATKHQLNREGLELYLKVKDDFAAALDKIEEVWRADAIRSIADPIALSQAVAEITREMQILRSKPYFPHARFGDWTVSVRDVNGKLVLFQQFESERERDAAFHEARRNATAGETVQRARMPEEVRQFRGLPPQLLKQIGDRLQLSNTQRDWLDTLIFDMSPANSFAKRLKRRKGIAGWSLDAMRNYANYFLHAGNYLARIEHSWALEEAIKQVRSDVKSLETGDKRQLIADYMDRHFAYIMNPPNEWQAIRGAAFTWLLGFAPDSALVNLSQVPLVAYPYLAARFGDGRALKALTDGARLLPSLYKLKAKLGPDKLQALQLAVAHGFIDESQAMELAAASEGGTLQRMIPGNSIQHGIMVINRAAAYMFQSVEKLNRMTVFSAAFDLGKQHANSTEAKIRNYINDLTSANQELYQSLIVQGWTPENAVGFLVARDAIDSTQFEYAQWARPEFMRGKKGVLFTFFMFKQQMLWFLRYQPGSVRALALLLFSAGLMGMPGAEDLNDILKMLLRQFNIDFNPELELRKYIAELTERPDLVMHGMGRESFGLTMLGEMMGIPIPGLDFSSRLGFGRVVPGVEAATTAGLTFDERLGRMTESILGAAYGIPMGLVQGISSFNPQDFKSYERLLPRAFKNMVRGTRYLIEGEERDAAGASLYKFDVMDAQSRLEAAGAFLGFVPTGLRSVWDRNRAIQEGVSYWQARRAALFDQLYSARRARDREALADVRSAIRQFNREAPHPKLRITVESMKRSFAGREAARHQREAGRAQSATMEPVARSIRGAYPEASQQ